MRFLVHSLFVISACLPTAGIAAPTTISISSATAIAADTSQSVDFIVARSGDLSYSVFVTLHTADGSAISGIDYTAIGGGLTLAANSNASTIQVPINAQPETGNSSRVFSLILDSATGPGPAPSFGALQVFNVGANPTAIAAADINGDGKPDLVVTNYIDNSISILINTTITGSSSLSFAPQQIIHLGGNASSLIVSDFNGDGRPDIAAATVSDGDVSVLLNTTPLGAAKATFAGLQVFDIGIIPSIIKADVNGDGKPDIVASNRNAKTVSILLNTTPVGADAASFALKQVFANGTAYPYSIAAGDFNNDGKPDFAVVSIDAQNVSSATVFFNSTPRGADAATLLPPQILTTGVSGASSLAVADLTGDGYPDIVEITYGDIYLDGVVSILPNITAPGSFTAAFSSPFNFNTGWGAAYVTASDLTGDGLLDLIVVNNLSWSFSVLSGSVPSASPPWVNYPVSQSFATGKYPNGMAIADFNGDGLPDVAVANSGAFPVNGNTISVYTDTQSTPVSIVGSPASGLILSDHIFGNGFE